MQLIVAGSAREVVAPETAEAELATNSICKTYMSCAENTEVTLCTAPRGSHCGSYGSSKIVDTSWNQFEKESLP